MHPEHGPLRGGRGPRARRDGRRAGADGRRRPTRDGRVVLVGSAFSVMAAAALRPRARDARACSSRYNGLVAFTGGATLPVGGAILALSALPSLRRPEGVRPLLVLVVATSWPRSRSSARSGCSFRPRPGVPEQSAAPPRSRCCGLGLAFYGLLAAAGAAHVPASRADTADLAVVGGIVWLAAALVGGAHARTTGSSAGGSGTGSRSPGIALVGGVVAFDLHRAPSRDRSLGDLRARSSSLAEEAFLGSHVRALIVCARARRTTTPRGTPGGSRCSRSSPARSSAWRPAGCARSRPAASSTTSASSRCPGRRSSRSRTR